MSDGSAEEHEAFPTRMPRTPWRVWPSLLVFVAAAWVGSWAAPRATLLAVDIVVAAELVGLSSALIIQLARDGAAAFAVVAAVSALWHVARRSHVVMSLSALMLLAALEPFFVATELVAAEWTSIRLLARLSALTFALTLASYLDTLAEQPARPLRRMLRLFTTFFLSWVWMLPMSLAWLVARASRSQAWLDRVARLAASGIGALAGIRFKLDSALDDELLDVSGLSAAPMPLRLLAWASVPILFESARFSDVVANTALVSAPRQGLHRSFAFEPNPLVLSRPERWLPREWRLVQRAAD